MKLKTMNFILCIFLTTLTAVGQVNEKSNSTMKASPTNFNTVRTIQLENDSKTEEIIIEVKPKIIQMSLMINCSVVNGKLIIEVYDPNDVKQGTFTVGTQLNSNKKEYVSGNIQKNLNEPQSGKWKVKIIPTDASGTISIRNDIFE